MNVNQYPATHNANYNSMVLRTSDFPNFIQAKPLFKHFMFIMTGLVAVLGLLRRTLSILVLATEMESFEPDLCLSMLLILSVQAGQTDGRQGLLAAPSWSPHHCV